TCIVPAMVPLTVPDIVMPSVDPNELTCLAWFAARVISSRGDSAWAARCMPLLLLPPPQPAASRTAAAPAAQVTMTLFGRDGMGPPCWSATHARARRYGTNNRAEIPWRKYTLRARVAGYQGDPGLRPGPVYRRCVRLGEGSTRDGQEAGAR